MILIFENKVKQDQIVFYSLAHIRVCLNLWQDSKIKWIYLKLYFDF